MNVHTAQLPQFHGRLDQLESESCKKEGEIKLTVREFCTYSRSDPFPTQAPGAGMGGISPRPDSELTLSKVYPT